MGLLVGELHLRMGDSLKSPLDVVWGVGIGRVAKLLLRDGPEIRTGERPGLAPNGYSPKPVAVT